MKNLGDATVKTLTGPYRVPELDDDGEAIEKEGAIPACNDCGRPETSPELVMKDGSVKDVLRLVIFSIPDSIQAKNDPLRVAQVWNQLEHSNGAVELRDKAYDWLHRLMGREIPVTKARKDEGIKPKTYSAAFFGLSSAYILEQLKDVDERKSLDELDVDDDSED